MSIRSESPAYKSAMTSRFSQAKVPPRNFQFQELQAYKYRPLRDPNAYVRLVYLTPCRCKAVLDGKPAIRCELMTHAVTQTPPYVALSYTWGDALLRRPILIGTRLFYITENLAVALEHLQENEKTLVLWIDSLCINQNDEVEKSAQVNRMGKIFKSASIVVAWLGPSENESDLALRKLQEAYEKFWSQNVSFTHWIEHISLNESLEAFPKDPIIDLVSRAWFKRVWVMQEVVINREALFVVGKADIWRGRLINGLLMFGAVMARHSLFNLPLHIGRFSDMRQEQSFGAYLEHARTQATLGFGTYMEASEPRDFVYSHFGLVADLEAAGLKVDYSKTVEEVYTDFAKAIVRTKGTGWLMRFRRPSHRYPSLPSWVPDWSDTQTDGTFIY
ncbi:HET-domain-containing protein [Xylariaceae sp. AK1471]|nr:HET-domain-containing protein [Xylariaceae sp. AK1471]